MIILSLWYKSFLHGIGIKAVKINILLLETTLSRRYHDTDRRVVEIMSSMYGGRTISSVYIQFRLAQSAYKAIIKCYTADMPINNAR